MKSDPPSELHPLSVLGVARAYAAQGDKAKSRKAYQDFLALWHDADADLPILIDAGKAFEKMALETKSDTERHHSHETFGIT